MQENMDYKELIIKFITKEITENEIDVLKSYLDKDAESRRIFNQENELWQESDAKTNLEYFKTDEGWYNISSKLGIGKNRFKSVIINKYKFRMMLAAASVACLIGIGGLSLWLIERDSVKHTVVANTIVSTDEGQKVRIYLSDSTQVYMNSGSSIKYDANYNIHDRKVKLTGEAFFDVRTNPEKPFVVQLGKMTVSATGTRFNVLSYDNENRIETTLEEGKIQIAIKGQDIINMKSGQQVVYFTNTNKAVVRDVPTETYTSWKENKLRFNDTPLEETLRKIGRKYNVTFQILNRDILDLKYTATFIDESIEEVMQMLKAVSPITYRINYRTTVNDKKYLKPKIIVGKRKPA
jgi:transmembrane sensor